MCLFEFHYLLAFALTFTCTMQVSENALMLVNRLKWCLYSPLQGIFFKAFNCRSMSSFDESMSNMKKCLGITPMSLRRRSIDCDKEDHHPVSVKRKGI